MTLHAPDRFAPERVILTASSRFHYHDHPTGALSLKTMMHGRAVYSTPDGKRIAVDDSGYLILNERQPYTIHIETPVAMTSFCIFFPDGMGQEVLRSLTTPIDALLDQPSANGQSAPGFFETLIPHDDLVTPAVREIQSAYQRGTADAEWLEERLGLLLARMLHAQHRIGKQMARLPAARPATRAELYRRLCLARDAMHASLDQPMPLAEVARIAALSPYHFLRTFKQAFGQTPHEYLTQVRLERAKFLLRHTDQPVTEICFELGFASLGSFSTLFRSATGFSPRAFRQQAPPS